MPSPSSNELSTARSRTSASTQQHQQQQQQQQHPFVSARVDQFMSRHQLTALQPVRPLQTTGRDSGWQAGRKLPAADDDSLDRLVEINATQLFNRGNPTTRSSSAIRRPPLTTNVVTLPSTVYGRAKVLPVTNNVAKPFSTGRNY